MSYKWKDRIATVLAFILCALVVGGVVFAGYKSYRWVVDTSHSVSTLQDHLTEAEEQIERLQGQVKGLQSTARDQSLKLDRAEFHLGHHDQAFLVTRQIQLAHDEQLSSIEDRLQDHALVHKLLEGAQADTLLQVQKNYNRIQGAEIILHRCGLQPCLH